MGGYVQAPQQQQSTPKLGATSPYQSAFSGFGALGSPMGSMFADGIQGFGAQPQQNSGFGALGSPIGSAWGSNAQPWSFGGYQPMNTQNTPNNTWSMGQVNDYNSNQTTPGTLGNGADYFHLPSPDQVSQYNQQDQQAAQNYQPPAQQQSPMFGGLNDVSAILGGPAVQAPVFQQGANPIAQRDSAYANSIGDLNGGWWL